MSAIIDEYRRRLAQIATTATVILGTIADAEERLNELKKETRQIYEKIDDILDIEK